MPDNVLETWVTRIGWKVDPPTEVDRTLDKTEQHVQARAVALGNLVAAGVQKAAGLALRAASSLATALPNALGRFAEVGDEIAKTATKLGVTTDSLQRLRFAAERSGVDAAKLGEAIKKLNTGMDEARTKGTGPFADGLKLVGVALEELEGLDPEDQVGVLADALNEIPDPAQRAAAAAKLFGEGAGSELAPLLAEGAEGIIALGDEAERLGLVLSRDSLAGAEALDDALGDLEKQMGIVGTRIASQLAPYATDLVQRFSDWIAANDEFIEQDLPRYIEATVETLIAAVEWAADAAAEFKQFGREVGFVVDEVQAFGKEIADAASMVADTLAPAIDVALIPLKAMWTFFSETVGFVGRLIEKLADMLGVLDDIKQAVRDLPLVGESVDELDQRLDRELAENAAKRGQGFTGAGGGPGRSPGREAADATRADVLARSAAGSSVLDSIAASFGSQVGQQSRVDRARRRAAGRASLAKGGGGGGGSSGGKGGDLWDRMFPGLKWGSEPSALSGLGELLGVGATDHKAAGGGGSPLGGGSFARITNTVHAPTTISITLPKDALRGLSPTEQARLVATEVANIMDERNRRVADFFDSTMREG